MGAGDDGNVAVDGLALTVKWYYLLYMAEAPPLVLVQPPDGSKHPPVLQGVADANVTANVSGLCSWVSRLVCFDTPPKSTTPTLNIGRGHNRKHIGRGRRGNLPLPEPGSMAEKGKASSCS